MLVLLVILLSGSDIRGAMIVLVLITIAEFLFAYFLWQLIRSNMAALSIVTRPPDMVGSTTDTVETF